MVPWNYNYNYVNEATMENILGIRSMTRNGRCYTFVTIEKFQPKLAEKVPKQKEAKVVSELIKG